MSDLLGFGDDFMSLNEIPIFLSFRAADDM